jgi:hypothetical protein
MLAIKAGAITLSLNRSMLNSRNGLGPFTLAAVVKKPLSGIGEVDIVELRELLQNVFPQRFFHTPAFARFAKTTDGKEHATKTKTPPGGEVFVSFADPVSE